MRIVVDFPAPLGPRNPQIAPDGMSNVTWSTATNESKRRVRPSARTARGPRSAPVAPAGSGIGRAAAAPRGRRRTIRAALFFDHRDEHVLERRRDRLRLEHRG